MLKIRYRSTNCFFVESGSTGKLLAVDAGWPCTMLEYQRGMKSVDLSVKKIAWCVVTHFHMDHAGLVEDFINCGITCLVTPEQVLCIDAMETTILKNREYAAYKRIDKSKLVIADLAALNAKLRALGIAGTLVSTPSHSTDSLSFIADNREAIIGDLAPLGQIMDDDKAALADWARIKEHGAFRVFPSHASEFDIG